jgi:hypothetical protein
MVATSSFTANPFISVDYRKTAKKIAAILELSTPNTVGLTLDAVKIIVFDTNGSNEFNFSRDDILVIAAANSTVQKIPLLFNWNQSGESFTIYAIEQYTDGSESILRSRGAGNPEYLPLLILSPPAAPLVEFVANPTLAASSTPGNILASGINLKIGLLGSNGGAPLSNYSIFQRIIPLTGVAISTKLSGAVISAGDITTGYIVVPVSNVDGLAEASKLMFFVSLDNGSVESSLSQPVSFVCSLKPIAPIIVKATSGLNKLVDLEISLTNSDAQLALWSYLIITYTDDSVGSKNMSVGKATVLASKNTNNNYMVKVNGATASAVGALTELSALSFVAKLSTTDIVTQNNVNDVSAGIQSGISNSFKALPSVTTSTSMSMTVEPNGAVVGSWKFTPVIGGTNYNTLDTTIIYTLHKNGGIVDTVSGFQAATLTFAAPVFTQNDVVDTDKFNITRRQLVYLNPTQIAAHVSPPSISVNNYDAVILSDISTLELKVPPKAGTLPVPIIALESFNTSAISSLLVKAIMPNTEFPIADINMSVSKNSNMTAPLTLGYTTPSAVVVGSTYTSASGPVFVKQVAVSATSRENYVLQQWVGPAEFTVSNNTLVADGATAIIFSTAPTAGTLFAIGQYIVNNSGTVIGKITSVTSQTSIGVTAIATGFSYNQALRFITTEHPVSLAADSDYYVSTFYDYDVSGSDLDGATAITTLHTERYPIPVGPKGEASLARSGDATLVATLAAADLPNSADSYGAATYIAVKLVFKLYNTYGQASGDSNTQDFVPGTACVASFYNVSRNSGYRVAVTAIYKNLLSGAYINSSEIISASDFYVDPPPVFTLISVADNMDTSNYDVVVKVEMGNNTDTTAQKLYAILPYLDASNPAMVYEFNSGNDYNSNTKQWTHSFGKNLQDSAEKITIIAINGGGNAHFTLNSPWPSIFPNGLGGSA